MGTTIELGGMGSTRTIKLGALEPRQMQQPGVAVRRGCAAELEQARKALPGHTLLTDQGPHTTGNAGFAKSFGEVSIETEGRLPQPVTERCSRTGENQLSRFHLVTLGTPLSTNHTAQETQAHSRDTRPQMSKCPTMVQSSGPAVWRYKRL